MTKKAVMHKSIIFIAVGAAAALSILWAIKFSTNSTADRCITYTINTKTKHLQFFWKDDTGKNFGSIQNLKLWLQQRNNKLLFAMNAGMYKPNHAPQGLYIENKKILSLLDTANGHGNFYLKPNGIFYITIDNTPAICTSDNFKDSGKVLYATQSGPMLVIEGNIHPAFKQGSANLNIRNGVGILPGNKVVFAMSKEKISFHDFALYFKRMGCNNALYLDGLVSRMYLPEKNWIQTDGDFGVLIGVTENK